MNKKLHIEIRGCHSLVPEKVYGLFICNPGAKKEWRNVFVDFFFTHEKAMEIAGKLALTLNCDIEVSALENVQ